MVFEGATSTRLLRRRLEYLVSCLVRSNPVPAGTVLLTGTGIVPPDDVALRPGDVVEIKAPTVGVLRNPVIQV